MRLALFLICSAAFAQVPEPSPFIGGPGGGGGGGGSTTVTVTSGSGAPVGPWPCCISRSTEAGGGSKLRKRVGYGSDVDAALFPGGAASE